MEKARLDAFMRKILIDKLKMSNHHDIERLISFIESKATFDEIKIIFEKSNKDIKGE